MAAYDVYTTSQLIGMYGVVDTPNPFIYDVFFRNEIAFPTRQVFFDKVQRARRLAPLVSPHVEGRPEPLRAYNAMNFTPAYIKAKKEIEPDKLLIRRAGETLNGDYSLQERRDLIVMEAVRDLTDQVTRRMEYMGVQLLLKGSMVIQSVDFPAVTVDMGRPAGNTVVLSGATAWGAPGVDALAMLVQWSSYVQQVSGFNPKVVVMSPDAFSKFVTSPGVLEVMNSFRQTQGNINLAGYAIGGNGNEAVLMGNIAGFEIWQYQSFYQDADGTLHSMLPPNTVIMGDPVGCGGTRLYGAIQDHQSLEAIPIFPKMWMSEDPSAEYVMVQSAPLPVLGWAEATFCATVA